jgi:transcriptional regulator with XRE-family HTH domain
MKLKDWREATGLTKTQLAEMLSKLLNRKISASHITAWESGTMPGWDTGEAISMVSGKKISSETIA